MTHSVSNSSFGKTLLVRAVQVAIAAGLLVVVGILIWKSFGQNLRAAAHASQYRNRSIEKKKKLNWRRIGDEAYQKRQWNKAIKAYRHELERHPDSLFALVRLAYSLHSAGRLDEALDADILASRSPYARSWALYNIACIYAVKQERELALDYLHQAIEAGFRSNGPLRNDPDLASLVDNPEFQQLEQLAKPLQLRAAYHRLDFLLGRWNLWTKGKERDGIFELRHTAGGCGLAGSFLDSAIPMTAAVTAYYDPATKKWRQLWFDDHGGVIDLVESSASANEFVFEGQWLQPNGDRTPAQLKISLKRDRSVQLLLSESHDSRLTWDTVVRTRLVRRRRS